MASDSAPTPLESTHPEATAAILATGEELITGRRTDTNSTFLQQRLRTAGYRVTETRQVGDRLDEMVPALDELMSRVDVLMVTGGLGPTEDDRTREAVGRVLGVPVCEDPAARRHLDEMFQSFGRTPSLNLRQATLPQGAHMLTNPHGTAPGFQVHGARAWVFCMPGVPREMYAMMDDQVLPLLRASASQTPFVHRILEVAGLSESELGRRLEAWMRSAEPPEVAVTAHDGTISVCLTDQGDREGKSRLESRVAEVRGVLGDCCFAEGPTTLEEVVIEELRRRHETVAVAESLTGGQISSWLVRVAGASDVFGTGIVAYSNEIKQRVLGVPGELLEAHGAVSEEVACAMAEGVRSLAGADYGLATTGIAGPEGGTETKPLGLVWMGLASARGITVRRFDFPGDRNVVRRRASITALDLLRRHLL